jgi:hypothetical protein
MFIWQPPDRSKLISWDESKVRWLGYYYLMGSIVGVYLLAVEEWLFAIPSPVWLKIFLTVGVFAPLWSAGSVWFYRRGWLR